MKSHLSTILERIAKLMEEHDPKATYNFEKNGEVLVTLTFDEETEEFGLKYPKEKEPSLFDSIDLVAIEVYYLLFDED